jgi:RNA polymerase sigma-70 factor (sigma-E family)
VDLSFEQYAHARLAALTRLAYLLTGDHHRAEDLVQVALAHCFARWRTIRDPDAYVRRALINAERSWWRARWTSEAPQDTVADRPADEDVAAAVVGRDAVLRALSRLPSRQRAVIVLFYFEDLAEPAVAEALGISVGAVKSHRTRGLAQLRRDPDLALTTTEVPR